MQVGPRGTGPERLPAAVYSCPLWQDPRLALAGGRGEFSGDRTACPTRSNELLPEPGRPFSTRLLTGRAGVHVDFHAHRHFHDLRSFPTHEGLPSSVWHDVRAGSETRWTSNVAQARNIRPRSIWTHLTPAISLLGKASSLLDKGNE